MTHLPQKTALTQWGSLKIAAMLCILAFALSSVACTATTPAKKTMPVWPNNGIAQREFVGNQMFVENDRGIWRAWVLSMSDNEKGEALDFFSGKRQRVTLKYYRDGHPAPEFVDARGRRHRWAQEVDLHFDDERPGGGVGGVGFDGGDVVGENLQTPDKADYWRKAPLFLSPPSREYPKGRWQWQPGFFTALDLGDGTFLATTEFWVFRLRMSDLSPAGSAPALHIVNAEDLEAVIKDAEGQVITDPATYLESTLHLPPFDTTPAQSKEK